MSLYERVAAWWRREATPEDDAELRRRRSEAARRFASGFSWEATAARYEALYREIGS